MQMYWKTKITPKKVKPITDNQESPNYLSLTWPWVQGYVSRIYDSLYVTNTDCFGIKGAMSPGLGFLIDLHWGI